MYVVSHQILKSHDVSLVPRRKTTNQSPDENLNPAEQIRVESGSWAFWWA
jgi:hypothetical protein